MVTSWKKKKKKKGVEKEWKPTLVWRNSGQQHNDYRIDEIVEL